MGSGIMFELGPAPTRYGVVALVALMATGCAANSFGEGPTNTPSSPAEYLGAYVPDFSYAGYRNGEALEPVSTGTRINVTDFGAIPDDGIDDSRAILDAIDTANAVDGTVILEFPAGELIVTEVLPITRGDIVLRGQGRGDGGTRLHFPRPLDMVDTGSRFSELREYLAKYDKRQREPDRNVDYMFSEYSWTGGFIWIQRPGTRAASYLESYDPPIEVLTDITSGKRGDKTVSVVDPDRLEEGEVIQLQWFNREGEDGALIDSIYGDTDLAIGSHHWTFVDRPVVRQMTKVVSINGAAVTLSDPLLHDVNDALPAQAAVWDHLQNVGIEGMRLTFPNAISFGHHLERGYNGIYFTSVFNGWIRDVSFSNADSGVLSYNSANLTFQTIRADGLRRAHYAVHLGNVHNVLVSDLIVAGPVIHPLTFNTQSTRSVYRRSTVFEAPVLDQHAGSNHQNLFDETTVYISAERDEDGAYYDIWDGSGAGYWQPGHGRFNTTWNLSVIVEDGAAQRETVRLRGLAEGPDARLVGIQGNRPFEIEYVPQPVSKDINRKPPHRSLYDWQLELRTDLD